MAIKVSGTEVISDDKRILNNEDLPDIRPSLLLDFANSKTLDPRITFTRGSTATYYDGKTTAKAEENLITRSQDFSTIWTFGPSGAAGTITNNNATAPDGTTTAALIQATATTSQHYLQRPSSYYSPVSGQTYTLSCYLKAGTVDDVQFVFGNSSDFGSAAYINVDLTAGTITHTASSISASSITDVGNGWYRVTMSATAIGSNGEGNFITSFVDPAAPTGRLQNFTTAGTETYYIWGCQVEQRSSATAYTATTTSPIVKYQPVLQTAASGEARFDHDPVTGESKGLLIEEARTNLFPYSEAFDNAAWAKVNSTISNNAAVAPDGQQTADLLLPSTVEGVHLVREMVSLSAAKYTLSVFAKSGGSDWLYMTHVDGDGSSHSAAFNLDSGTAGTVSSTATSAMEDVGNGWFRCSITPDAASAASSSQNQFFYVAEYNNDTNFSGDGYSGIYLWGAQVEQGSFPTSYIPTSGSTVTRAADGAEMTGTNFTDWYAQGEGSLYAKVTQFTSADYTVRLSDSSGSNKIELLGFSGQQFRISFNGVSYLLDAGQPLDNIEYEIVASYKADDIAACIDGGAVSESTSALIPYVDKMEISVLSSESHYIKKIAYYPKRLPNATLQAMTEA